MLEKVVMTDPKNTSGQASTGGSERRRPIFARETGGKSDIVLNSEIVGFLLGLDDTSFRNLPESGFEYQGVPVTTLLDKLYSLPTAQRVLLGFPDYPEVMRTEHNPRSISIRSMRAFNRLWGPNYTKVGLGGIPLREMIEEGGCEIAEKTTWECKDWGESMSMAKVAHHVLREKFGHDSKHHILDVGTGSGAQAAAFAKDFGLLASVEVVSLEKNPFIARNTQRNLRLTGVNGFTLLQQNGVDFIRWMREGEFQLVNLDLSWGGLYAQDIQGLEDIVTQDDAGNTVTLEELAELALKKSYVVMMHLPMSINLEKVAEIADQLHASTMGIYQHEGVNGERNIRALQVVLSRRRTTGGLGKNIDIIHENIDFGLYDPENRMYLSR